MNKIYCGIYYIKNTINNKYYVGQSINIHKRWREERRALNGEVDAWNTHLQNAWKKYGANNFEFRIIEECDQVLLNEREIFWIKQLHAFTNGYNLTSGGRAGVIVSDATRNKIRQIWSDEERRKKARQLQIQRWEDPVIRESMSGENNHNYGKRPSTETIEKMKQSRSWYIMSEETKQKISSAIKQYYINCPEARTIKSKKQKQYYEEHPNSVRPMVGVDNPNFGKLLSKETKDKIGESVRRYYETHPDARVKASEKTKQYNTEHTEFIENKKIPVNQYSKDGVFIKTWPSATDASRVLGISRTHISSCCVGKRKTAGGYCWKHCVDLDNVYLEVIG